MTECDNPFCLIPAQPEFATEADWAQFAVLYFCLQLLYGTFGYLYLNVCRITCWSSREVAVGGSEPKMERNNFSKFQENKVVTEICSAVLELLHADGQTYGHGEAVCALLQFFIFNATKCTSFSHGTTAPSGPGSPRFRGITITLIGRTPLDE
jgi:hypothetical protein